ncbi:glutathione S-transferase family protein [Halomonas cupida]|uniref:Glutathione S-transferase n=1 Tax=Halomonas cupida TaxID=44933 RepID=A0A1M7HW02_9GAMM|nr:glutathione S-transferase family protein [Halomonas cupida]GEN23920.1 glutathione S-transferase [Halomonas cupida]SHM32702.1 glutathione S-transferase [Halomonas cupida]
MKLYGLGPTRSLRVLWALNELDVDFEFISINLMKGEHLTPEFLHLNPAARVPVLVDGDTVLTESAAIVLYLAEKYPDKGLLPNDIKERAQVYRWTMFAMTELEQPLWRIARHTTLYPENQRLPRDIELARQDFVSMAAVLDQHMQARQFIVGNDITVADCVTAYLMDWANEEGLIDDQTALLAYLQRMYQRSGAPQRIARAMEELLH